MCRPLNSHALRVCHTLFAPIASTHFILLLCSTYLYYSYGHHTLNQPPRLRGLHVSVYAPILKGDYDAKLKWPFPGKVNFTLLNQLEDKNHYTGVMTLDTADNAIVGGIRWGCPKFIPHSALAHDPVKNTQYLKNNALYFRMEVEIEHKP